MLHGWQYLTPEDRENILRGVIDNTVYGGPYHLELDWVDKCNARCFFCNSEYTHNGRSIPWERARALLEEAVAGGLHSIRLAGGGEPTLHPQFTDLVRFLGQNDIVLDNLTTNGTLLTDRAIEALMTVRVSDLRVSLNYPTPDAWSEGMGLPPKIFDRVTRQLARLSQARRGNPRFGKLTIQFFVCKATLGLIGESYRLARELGVDLITYRELWGVDPAVQCAPEDGPALFEAMRAIIREDWTTGIVQSHLEAHGIGEKIKRVYEELRAEMGEKPPLAPQDLNYWIRYCYMPWYSMTIMGSQAAYPCCYLIPMKGLPPLGNLPAESLSQVWRGAAYARLRREMRDFMILQRQVPFFNKRVRRIGPACASHDGCPFTRSLCDESFYEEAECRLAEVRRRPLTQLWRQMNRAGRLLERKLRRG